MCQNERVFGYPVSVDLRVLATEPPMRVERGLGKVCAATVHMATKPQGVHNSLGNAMSVCTSDIETDSSTANGFPRIGGVP